MGHRQDAVAPMLAPQAASLVMARMRDQSRWSDPLAGLTAQERRILELIGEGMTNRQIGERMHLAEKTVKNYVSALFAKLSLGAELELTTRASYEGLHPQLHCPGDRHDLMRLGEGSTAGPPVGAAVRGGSAWPLRQGAARCQTEFAGGGQAQTASPAEERTCHA